MQTKTFTVDGKSFKAEQCIDGVLINPVLPKAFDNTANEDRPPGHQKWWYRSFIVSEAVTELDAMYAARTDPYADEGRKHWATQGRAAWMTAWPSGTRYDVRCLDGGAWDRSTGLGMFPTLDEALACAKIPARHYYL